MSNEIKPIAISTRKQVGHIIYRQRPSSKQLEDRELVMGDDYEEITYTGPNDRLAAIQEEVLNSVKVDEEETTTPDSDGSDSIISSSSSSPSGKCVQTTLTSMAGGLWQLVVRTIDCYYNPLKGNDRLR